MIFLVKKIKENGAGNQKKGPWLSTWAVLTEDHSKLWVPQNH